jgi:hypothetical protein
MVGIRLPVSFAVLGPPLHGIGAKRMRGHGGNGAAPRDDMLCGQTALLVAVLDVRLRLGISPTTSLSSKWRAYIAGLRLRQARRNGFLIDFVADFPHRIIDSFLTRQARHAQLSATTGWGSAPVSTQSFTSQAGRDKETVMLRRATRVNSAAKGTLGQGESCAIE